MRAPRQRPAGIVRRPPAGQPSRGCGGPPLISIFLIMLVLAALLYHLR
jgi:hypothetical protein